MNSLSRRGCAEAPSGWSASRVPDDECTSVGTEPGSEPYNENAAKALLIQLLCKYEEYKDHIIARFHELRTDGQNRTIPEIERIINMEMRALESEIVADREAREELIRATETRGHVFPETEYEKRLAASLNRVDATQAESDDIDVEIAKIKAETAEITERVEKKSVVCLLF